MSGQRVSRTLPDLYTEIAAHTSPGCAQCPTAYACCTPEGCQTAVAAGATLPDPADPGIINPEVPFLTKTGCRLKPHERPVCAIYSCMVRGDKQRRALFGTEEGRDWLRTYQELVNQIITGERAELVARAKTENP